MQIEVKRNRKSVTQGEAEVLINGKEVVTFADEIKMINEGQLFYDENIGGYASITPDSDFILGLLYHEADNIYHYSDLVKEAIKNCYDLEKSATQGKERKKKYDLHSVSSKL